MFSKSRSLLLAAALVAAPMVTAMAQQNNPTGNQGSNSSATATPTTGNNSPGAGAAARGTTGNYGGTSMNSTAPGATGKTVVPGSTSSQAGASGATNEQKAGPHPGGGTSGGK